MMLIITRHLTDKAFIRLNEQTIEFTIEKCIAQHIYEFEKESKIKLLKFFFMLDFLSVLCRPLYHRNNH